MDDENNFCPFRLLLGKEEQDFSHKAMYGIFNLFVTSTPVYKLIVFLT